MDGSHDFLHVWKIELGCFSERFQPFHTHTQTHLCCEVRLIVLIVLVPTACGLGIFVSVDPSGQT